MNYFKSYIVTDPSVDVTAPSTQTVSQSLTLQCSVTTVRGITSRVDIVWSSDGTVLKRITGLSVSSTTNNIAVYMDSYTIQQLSETNNGRVIQCEVVINANPPVMATGRITLGEYIDICIIRTKYCIVNNVQGQADLHKIFYICK